MSKKLEVNSPDKVNVDAFESVEVMQAEEAYNPAGKAPPRGDWLGEATTGKVAAAGTGLKFDADKPRMDLLPPGAIAEVAAVLTYGANKYAANNDWQWRNGMKWSRPLAAALRHIFAWSSGQDGDVESSKNHLAHAAVNLLFLITYQQQGIGEDDRAKEDPTK